MNQDNFWNWHNDGYLLESHRKPDYISSFRKGQAIGGTLVSVLFTMVKATITLALLIIKAAYCLLKGVIGLTSYLITVYQKRTL